MRKKITFYKTPWYCPSCGQQDMWQKEEGSGDYYHDSYVECKQCEYVMCCVEALSEKERKGTEMEMREAK